MKIGTAVIPFLVMIFATSCSQDESSSYMPREWPPHIKEIDSDRVVYNLESGYSGRAGVEKFLDCAGLSRRQLEFALPPDFSPALVDFFTLAGTLSDVSKGFDSRGWRPGKVVDVLPSALDYLPFMSVEMAEPGYRWSTSGRFLSNYHLRQDPDNTVYAPMHWYKDMYVLGADRTSAIFLANPHVLSSDGE